eukprot:NODE_627_length_5881_cov_0.181771.p1 type:complete len:644 gc:universal NODE_627_length_5881_cov_0.181771:3778-5709(+)
MGIEFPDPPTIIFNVKKGKQYHRFSTLGQGGFAKCYKVTCDQNEYAMKCVYKKSLKNPKHISKLKSEIKIHSQLSNERIVKCFSYFEDREYVYLLLELCHLKTLANMLRVRHRLTEPECRYFMLQICDALEYLHDNHIIHRDLKLGNILLTRDMHIKLADFGLAAAVTNEERKKTLCGTPNYLAPEILHGTENGHSYEVDIWSFGCVMYTLLIGKPPFQSKDVNEIYLKIKKVEFEFPSTIPLSNDSIFLIKACLQSRPELRPSAAQIKQFSFFKQFIPALLPVSALSEVPDFDDVTPTLSQSYKSLQRSDSKHEDLMIISPEKPKLLQTPAKSKIPTYIHNNLYNSPMKSITKRKRNTIQQFYDSMFECAVLAESIYDLYSMPVNWARQRTSDICTPTINAHHNPFASIFTNRQSTMCAPKHFILKWIDYSNKYGLSYQITDGSVGILFNDLSSILLSPNEQIVNKLEYKMNGDRSSIHIEKYSNNELPDVLLKKYKMCKEFKRYMEKNLSQVPITVEYDQNKSVFLQKWLRFKHAVVFRLSNNTIQMNFQDHTKLIVGDHGLMITYITSNKQIYSCTIDEALIPVDEQMKMMKMTSINDDRWPKLTNTIKMENRELTTDVCRDIQLRIIKMIEFLQVLANR